MLALACSGLGVPPSLDHCMAHFSMDFTRIVGALLASPDGNSPPPLPLSDPMLCLCHLANHTSYNHEPDQSQTVTSHRPADNRRPSYPAFNKFK